MNTDADTEGTEQHEVAEKERAAAGGDAKGCGTYGTAGTRKKIIAQLLSVETPYSTAVATERDSPVVCSTVCDVCTGGRSASTAVV